MNEFSLLLLKGAKTTTKRETTLPRVTGQYNPYSDTQQFTASYLIAYSLIVLLWLSVLLLFCFVPRIRKYNKITYYNHHQHVAPPRANSEWIILAQQLQIRINDQNFRFQIALPIRVVESFDLGASSAL